MTPWKLAVGTAFVFFAIGGVAYAFNRPPKVPPVMPSQAPLNAAVLGMNTALEAATKNVGTPPAEKPRAKAPVSEPATTTPAALFVPAPATTTPSKHRVATTTATTSQSVRTADENPYQLAANTWLTYFKHHRK